MYTVKNKVNTFIICVFLKFLFKIKSKWRKYPNVINLLTFGKKTIVSLENPVVDTPFPLIVFFSAFLLFY